MTEPDNLVLVQLRELRGAIDLLRQDIREQNQKFDRGERLGHLYLRNFTGHRNMVERSFASFEEDLGVLGIRMTALENSSSDA